MRFIFTLALISVLSVSTSYAEFHGFEWGTSKAKVKSGMNKKPASNTDNFLLYADSLVGIDTKVNFGFDNGKLARGGYVTNNFHMDDEQYLDDYLKIKSALLKKYGPPTFDNFDEIESLFERDHKAVFKAVKETGETGYFCRWSLKNKTIKLIFNRGPEGINLQTMLLYQRPGDGKKLAEQQKKEEDRKL